MKNKYSGYFKEHYGVSYKEVDVLNYEKWFSPQWRIVSQKIKLDSSSNILEIGSGFGGFYKYIKNNTNLKYLGIELDSDAVRFSNSYYRNNVFKNISLEELPTHNKYNYIFAFEVLEHLSNPIEAVNKISLHLNNKGVFCGTTPYPYYKNIIADQTHLFLPHPENWKRIFLGNGFRKVEILPMSFFPYLWRLNPQLNVRIPFFVPFKTFISTSLIFAYK